jgi:hypothetical protein
MSSDGFRNILVNKLADEIRRYYSGNMADELNLLPAYIDAFLLEFGDSTGIPYVHQILMALAIATASCLHASYQPGEPNEALLSRIALARACATSQAAKIEALFPMFENDTDSE